MTTTATTDIVPEAGTSRVWGAETGGRFQLHASYVSGRYQNAGAPQTVEGVCRFDTRDEAEAVAAGFPKSCRVRVTHLTTDVRGDDGRYVVVWCVTFRAELVATRANRGVNETGLRRFRSFVRSLDERGYGRDWVAPYVNSYPTESEFAEATS